MNDPQVAISILKGTIQYNKRHPDYERVVALAKEYYDIFTAKGTAEFLKKFHAKKDNAQFQQMIDIYESVIPSVVDNLDTVFEKPLRSNRVFSSIETPDNKSRDEILDRMKRFYQGQSDSGVDAYLQERWKHDVVYDPNAWMAIEFDSFDNKKEKATPFAIEYTSKEVIDFAFKQGVTDWVIIELPHQYKKKTTDGKDELIDGNKYIMYLENVAIVFTQVDKDDKGNHDIKGEIEYVDIFDTDNKNVEKVFVQQIFQTKAQRVPVFRVGYKLDPVTNKRTCVSSIHSALAFFKKEMKSGAELDLTIRAHVFPQKYMYGPKCEGDKENGRVCKGGRTNDGEICSVCKGSGVQPVHTSSDDLIVVPLPKKGEEPVLDLRQAMAYFGPPIDLVKFMEEYCYRLTLKAKDAVFPSENILQQTEFAKTATELDYSWDTRYDALRKFAAKYSWVWVFIIKQIAIYTDNNSEGLVLYHKFPSDFKMKGAKTLLEEGKSADEGNFPQHVKAAIHNDIANIYYADDQDTLTKIQIKNKFHPFSGKSEIEVQTILMSDIILPYYKILYTYFDIIFDEIEQEHKDKFYALAFEKQKAIVDAKVAALQVDIDKQSTQSFKQAQKLLADAARSGQN